MAISLGRLTQHFQTNPYRQQSHIAYVSVWTPDFLPWSPTPPAPLLRSKSSQRRGDVGRRPPRLTRWVLGRNFWWNFCLISSSKRSNMDEISKKRWVSQTNVVLTVDKCRPSPAPNSSQSQLALLMTSRSSRSPSSFPWRKRDQRRIGDDHQRCASLPRRTSKAAQCFQKLATFRASSGSSLKPETTTPPEKHRKNHRKNHKNTTSCGQGSIQVLVHFESSNIKTMPKNAKYYVCNWCIIDA